MIPALLNRSNEEYVSTLFLKFAIAEQFKEKKLEALSYINWRFNLNTHGIGSTTSSFENYLAQTRVNMQLVPINGDLNLRLSDDFNGPAGWSYRTVSLVDGYVSAVNDIYVGEHNPGIFPSVGASAEEVAAWMAERTSVVSNCYHDAQLPCFQFTEQLLGSAVH